MQGLSKAQIEKIKAKLETAKTKIETKDQAQIATLTSHDVTGVMLQGVVQSYFALNDTQDRVVAGQASVDKDNKAENWINFNALQGSRMSANEHLVPEQFFNDPNATTKNVDGISAVKAIQIAASQGQKIYTINQSNIGTVLPLLNLKADTLQDIQNAVAAGKIVTTSQNTITKNGWTGSGYIILDPNTGAGAYMIGGGADGGLAFGLGLATSSIIAALIAGLLGLGGVSLGVAATAPFLLGLFVPLLIFFFMLIAVILYAHSDDEQFISCFIGGFAMNVLGFVGVVWSEVSYLLGFVAGASAVGTSGGCYGY